MPTLESWTRWSIYSLSAKEGGEGVNGLRPNRNQCTGVGRPEVTGRPEVREGPDVRRFGSGVHRSDVRWLRSSVNFFSGAYLPDVRRASVVHGPGSRRTSGKGRSSVACSFVLSSFPRCSVSQGSDVRGRPVVQCL